MASGSERARDGERFLLNIGPFAIVVVPHRLESL